MPKQIESYYQKLARMQKTNEEKDVKNREMEESVRDHFGFKVEMRDPRFVNIFINIFIWFLIRLFNNFFF